MKNEWAGFSFLKSSAFALHVGACRSVTGWGLRRRKGKVAVGSMLVARKHAKAAGTDEAAPGCWEGGLPSGGFTGTETLPLPHLMSPDKKMEFKTTTC